MPGLGWVSNCMSTVQKLSKCADGSEIGPHALAKALLRGLRIQLICTGEMCINNVGIGVAEEEQEFQEVLLDEWAKIHDNVTGSILNTGLVGLAPEFR